MITTQTVLVLGAGVSIPYGFPSGGELINTVLENLDGWRNIFCEHGIQEKLIGEFYQELRLSQQLSIDAFLENRPEFLSIGKLSIALSLFPCENEKSLFELGKQNKGCYRYLFSKLSIGWEEFGDNKVSIITFNYDRSLEQFLFTAIKHSYGKSDEQCAEVLGRIPIVHVHGSLGSLPWQSQNSKPYNSDYSEMDLSRAIERIIVISEGHENSPEFQQAKQIMEEAKRRYFLGFGYHPKNIQRLDVLKLQSIGRQPISDVHGSTIDYNYTAIGSAYGLEDSEIISILKIWKIFLPDPVSDSLSFLRRNAELD